MSRSDYCDDDDGGSSDKLGALTVGRSGRSFVLVGIVGDGFADTHIRISAAEARLYAALLIKIAVAVEAEVADDRGIGQAARRPSSVSD